MWWNLFTNAQIETALSNALNGGTPSASLIHQASITLDHSDLLGWLSGAPILLTGSPGLDRGLLPISVFSHCSLATDYDQVDPNFRIGTVGYGPYFTFLGQLPLAAQTPYTAITVNDSGFQTTRDIDSIINEGLALLSAASSITGGNAADSVVVCCEFRVFDRVLGRFLTTDESGWDADTRTFS